MPILASRRDLVSNTIWPVVWAEFAPDPQNLLDRQAHHTYIVHMNDIVFEWDEVKNRENKRKHGVSFEEARTVFLDESAIRFSDPDHSTDEDRFLMLGISFQLRVLVVCHCFRVGDAVIRLISARKASRREEAIYWDWK